ncbi:hypothetical protein ACKI2N_015410 [Cupriavidus sp. 30B13]|uniref:hypothetical protein n=1 Tax=Cupriavidus sp. 30B13 TaxID=3384241 RepID=UPI003B91AAC6
MKRQERRMSISPESPRDIYLNVSREVESILRRLGSASEDQQVSEAKKNTRAILEKFQRDIEGNIAGLERHAEWDTFTIAFYGETNAGKSTIIETLRIMLGEQSKAKAQQAFRTLREELGVSEENLEALRQRIRQGDALLTELQARLDGLVPYYDEQEQACRDEIHRLHALVVEKKRTATLWQKFLNRLRQSPEEQTFTGAEAGLRALLAERNGAVEDVARQQRETLDTKQAAERELERVERDQHKLEALADGVIIGNGRSDYTLETRGYAFEAGGHKFTLLDVPGIEGKEAMVMDGIRSAVQKAHAVFYVTGKAAAPQKGDEHTKGTLEKIKEHLGAQTEVWTLFNKRITNPMQLEKGGLASQDELESLQDLDEKMREQLGEHYQRVIPLSAQPAFLAVADCLVPGSQNAKSKDKFLARLKPQELLQRSNMEQFRELLAGNLVHDYKTKIRRSNFNKANQVVKTASDEVARIQRDSFKPLGQQLKQDANGSREQLTIALRTLKTRLETEGERTITGFKNAVRRRIYARIESDIGNDTFKNALESCIRTEQASLEQRLPGLMEAELNTFKAEIAEVVEQFQQYASELVETYGKIGMGQLDSSFELKISIDNGLKISNLLGSLVGGVLMIWNPAGWVALTIGAITLLVSLGKALVGFFSSSYKMSQQRKSADQNLETIADKMRDSLRGSLAVAFRELEENVEIIKEALNEPVRQVDEISATLLKSVAELKKLSKTIEAVGAQ